MEFTELELRMIANSLRNYSSLLKKELTGVLDFELEDLLSCAQTNERKLELLYEIGDVNRLLYRVLDYLPNTLESLKSLKISRGIIKEVDGLIESLQVSTDEEN